ncbi:SRPBCC family protein [Azospirillum thermophilum]|uniref:Carbon monoxide dehydrogenase n=1 Tax=Azospirillum thermophilum TaxID=2202148 RepID=A0A2S2CXI7_9PROT|nr:carbon monoxide dehydrogenase subunit G [Azospirillum thermophilum]AWK89201.1 carbon monoxide dehydrogenase [Azospirillum thermophilum]
MDMSGSQRIEAPRDRVWAALNDPEVLRQCIPGCEEVIRQSDTELTARVVAKVGPVSAKFSGKVTLSDLDPPNGYTITGEGSGGAAGFGKGGAKVALADDGSGTLLTYSAHAQVGGKLAQIGSRLVDATARKMADDFFVRFTNLVGEPAAGEAATEGEPAAAQPVAAGVYPAGPAAAAANPAAITPAREAPPPEVPLPSLKGRGGSGFYVPWAAILVVVLLLAMLSWMK